MLDAVDLLVTDVMTGRATGLARTVRRALASLAKVEVDLWIAEGDPEVIVIDQASPATVFGARARVATLEGLLLLYLYSNQPKHLGDFAAIVQSGRADIVRAERVLAIMHEEMLDEWRGRVQQALSPAPSPARPPPRPRRKAAATPRVEPVRPRRRSSRHDRDRRTVRARVR
jgi:hypothetical protein